jgi:hypothetical protein
MRLKCSFRVFIPAESHMSVLHGPILQACATAPVGKGIEANTTLQRQQLFSDDDGS